MEDLLDKQFFKKLFMTFYIKVDKFKQQGLLENYTDEKLEEISLELMNVLRSQEYEISKTSNSFIYSIYKEMQYAMVALADEVFLNFLNVNWSDRMLEKKIFNTNISGAKIFENIDKIIDQNNKINPLHDIYVYVLSLGFVGKYNLEANKQKVKKVIENYKQKLLNVSGKDKIDMEDLFSQAYEYKMSSENIYSDSIVYYWLKMFGMIFGAFILISYLSWSWNSYNFKNVINRVILETSSY